MAVHTRPWQCTVADFARMVAAGILAEDDRVELIDGEVRAMRPMRPRHVAIVKRLHAFLSRHIADRAIVSGQNPMPLTDYTEPQPDIAVLRPREDFYAQALPLPADVWFVVEVAETSLEYDRDEKIPRYAPTRIPEVWLIEVEQAAVTPDMHPDGTRYRRVQTLARGQPLSTDIAGPLHLTIDDILGSFKGLARGSLHITEYSSAFGISFGESFGNQAHFHFSLHLARNT